MNNMTPQRRKVVVLAASVAAMSGAMPMLLRVHPVLGFVWLGLMAGLLVAALVQFRKLQQEKL